MQFNVLLLNKKLYLLLDFWNQKRKLLLLSSRNERLDYNINYQRFFSLNYTFFEGIPFDYFNKWSSSNLIFSDLILKNYFDNKNKIKHLVDIRYSNDYTICDTIFDDYIINSIRNFFYFFKNKLVVNYYFKLSKKEDLLLKLHYYIYLFDYYILLNKNIIININVKYWKNNYHSHKFNIYLNYVKYFLLNKIKENFRFYFYYLKNIYNILCILTFNGPLICFHNSYGLFGLRNYLKNKRNFYFLNNFLKYIYFSRKFTRRMGKHSNKIFKKAFIKRRAKFNKGRLLWLCKNRFFSIISTNLHKMLKKKYFFSSLSNYKNKRIFLRNFYKFNNIIPFLNKEIKEKKKRKVKVYRVLKKLNTFYYIPNRYITKERVYRRFKNSVLFKYRKRKLRRSGFVYNGLRLNLHFFNSKNRYNNRMRALKNKKGSTPKYFFFRKKKNIYENRPKFLNYSIATLPDNIKRRYKIIDKINFGYLEKKNRELRVNCRKKLTDELNAEFKEVFLFFYNKKIKFPESNEKMQNISFFNYLKRLKKAYIDFKEKNDNAIKKKSDNKNSIRSYNYNKIICNKKRSLWFFQKFILFYKSLLNYKKKRVYFSYDYVSNGFNYVKLLYRKFLIIAIKWFNLFIFILLLKKKRKKYILNYILKLFFSFKLYFFYYSFIIRLFNRLKKKKKEIDLMRVFNKSIKNTLFKVNSSNIKPKKKSKNKHKHKHKIKDYKHFYFMTKTDAEIKRKQLERRWLRDKYFTSEEIKKNWLDKRWLQYLELKKKNMLGSSYDRNYKRNNRNNQVNRAYGPR